MIFLNHVSKTYKSECEVIKALDNVNLKFKDKGLVFISGKSGCGKTTLLNAIGLIDTIDSGSIIFDGINVAKASVKQKDRLRGSEIGFVFQDLNLLSEYNVEENISLPLKMQQKSTSKVNDVLKEVELEGFNTRKINELSGGQKQRVAIARALVKHPRVLLCDEPTGSLDEETSKKIFELLKSISLDTLVIVVSHDIEFANEYADRIITLKDGKVFSDLEKNVIECEKEKKEDNTSCASLKMKVDYSIRIMKKRIFRLFIAGLTSILSLSFFGSIFSTSIMSDNQVVAKSMIQNDDKYVTIAKNVYSKAKDESDLMTKYDGFMDDYDIKLIKEKTNSKYVDLVFNFIDCDNKNIREYYNWNDCYKPFFSNFVEINEDFISRYGFSLFGELPKNDDEVVISKYEYMVFKYYGYSNLFHQKEINEPNDLLGEVIYLGGKLEPKDYTICGILDTNFNEERYNTLVNDKNDILSFELEYYMANNIHNAVFFKDGFYQRNCKDFYQESIYSYANDFIYYAGEKLYECDYINKIDITGKKIFSYKDNIDSGIVLPISKWLIWSLDETMSLYVNNYTFDHFDEVKDKIAEEYPDSYINRSFYESLIKNAGYVDKYRSKDYSFFYDESIKFILFDQIGYDKIIDKITIRSSYMDKDCLYQYDVVGFLDDLSDPLNNQFYLTNDQYELLVDDMDWILDDYDFVMIPLDKSFKNVTKIMDCNKERYTYDKQSGDMGEEYVYSAFSIKNEYTYNILLIKETTSSFKNILKMSSVVLMLTSIVMMYLYFSGIVCDVRKELGILRSLGLSKGEIYQIFIFNNLLITICCFLVSIGGTLIGCNIQEIIFIGANSLLTFVNFDLMQVMTLLLVALGCSFIGSIIPIIRANKKNIVNMINDN